MPNKNVKRNATQKEELIKSLEEVIVLREEIIEKIKKEVITNENGTITIPKEDYSWLILRVEEYTNQKKDKLNKLTNKKEEEDKQK
jgi:hypothetical protein